MLNKIKIFFKKYWVFIILAAVVSGLLVLRLSQKWEQPPSIAPPAPTPQTSLNPPKLPGSVLPRDYRLSISDFSFPSRLKVYQGVDHEITKDDTEKIAQNFGFSQPAQKSEDVLLGTFHTWSTKTSYLSVALKAVEIDYGLDLSQVIIPEQGTLPSPQVASNILENLLSDLGLKPKFELKSQKEEYLSEGYYLQPATFNEASFIKIGSNPAIDQYQLIGPSPNDSLISLILNKDEEVVRFQYQVYFSGFESSDAYDLKTEEEVESLLLSEGRIVYFGAFQTGVKPPEITRAEFNQITLAYYQSLDKNPILQPIYILSGQGILESGETTEIIAYLPAVKFGSQAQQENLEVPREFFQLPELP